MRRLFSIIGSAVFLVVAPGVVAGYVPWTICHWHIVSPFFAIAVFRVIGIALIGIGLPLLVDCFARFALQGLGTPAPILPTRHLVVSGPYRYVRNPMYVAVSSLILGQGLFFGSTRVLEYGIAVWASFFFFVLVYEEPTLRRNFGSEFERFCIHVPRWIPRLHPWTGD